MLQFPSMTTVLKKRPRRNRRTEAIRDLVREHRLAPADLVQPVFVTEGRAKRSAIKSMPGIFRLSVDLAVREARELYARGIRAVALFPVVRESLKDADASE